MPLSSPRHFRRIELKYMIPDRLIGAFTDTVAPYTQRDPFLVEEGKGRSGYPVLSLYFDSTDLQSFREKEAGLLSRRKVRLRTYSESFSGEEPTFLEIKRRRDVVISKDRLVLPSGATDCLSNPFNALGEILSSVEKDGDVLAEARLLHSWYGLRPVCMVGYRRVPLVGMQDRRFRITIDRDIRGAWMPGQWLGDPVLSSCHPGWSVLELKCDHAVPAWFHHVVQEFDLQRIAHSKYALVMEDLRDSSLSNTFASFATSSTLPFHAARDS